MDKNYDSLLLGTFEEQILHEQIETVIFQLKSGVVVGVKLARQLWPNHYTKTVGLTNLWKVDLRDGWRLIYTIQHDEVRILNILLDWFNHKEYERRFGY